MSTQSSEDRIKRLQVRCYAREVRSVQPAPASSNASAMAPALHLLVVVCKQHNQTGSSPRSAIASVVNIRGGLLC